MGESSENRERRSCWARCCAAGCVLPVFLVLVTWALFTIKNQPPHLVIPTPKMPSDNGYDDFVRAGMLAQAMKHKAPASMVNPPTTPAGILAATEACTKDSGPMLAALRKGFGKECMGPPVRSVNDSLHTSHAIFREIEREISGVAQFYDLTNKPGKAAVVRLDGEELAVMSTHGGGVISALVAPACQSISLHGFEVLFPKLSCSELAQVCERLDQITAKWTPLSEVFAEEAKSDTAFIQDSFRDPKAQGVKAKFEAMQSMISSGNGRPTAKQIWEEIRFTFRDTNSMLEENLKYYEAVAEECKGPFKVKSTVPVPDNPFTQMSASMVDSVKGIWKGAEAWLTVIRVESALYLFRADKGLFPRTLLELQSGYLKGVPTDPCGTTAGASLHYKMLNGGKSFLLYSIGPDGLDNGGSPSKYATKPGGDIVAGKIR